MGNYISQYLRQAGVKAPYDDLTEAQIEEKDKMNPLSGYGFMSAKEKATRQQQRDLYDKQLQREQDMFQQQIMSRMTSQGQIGYHAGQGLMGLIDHLRNRNQTPGAAPDMNDDPQVARYNELASQVGPEMAMQMVGQENNNPGMIAAGEKAINEKQKTKLELQKLQSDVNQQGKPYKVGQVIPNIPITDVKGRPAKASYSVTGYDEKTGLPKLELWKEGLTGSVTDTASGFNSNPAAENQRTLPFEKLMASTADGLDSYDRLEKVVKASPNALGWSGGWVALADNAVNGIKGLAGTVAENNWKGDNSSKDISNYDFGKVSKVAGANERIKSIILQLAYQQAAATGDSSRSLSDKDIQFQIDQIGGQITNPTNLLDLMRQNKQVLVSRLKNQAHYIKIDGKPVGTGYETDIQGLADRVGLNDSAAAPLAPTGEYDGSTPPPANASDDLLRKRLDYLKNKNKGNK